MLDQVIKLRDFFFFCKQGDIVGFAFLVLQTYILMYILLFAFIAEFIHIDHKFIMVTECTKLHQKYMVFLLCQTDITKYLSFKSYLEH